MSDHAQLTQILERLAAGAIDTSEAARLIDALPARAGGQGSTGRAAGAVPLYEDPLSGPGAPVDEAALLDGGVPLDGEVLDAEVTEGAQVLRSPRQSEDADGLGRPQFATFLRDAFRRATSTGARSAGPQVSRVAVRAVGRRVRVVGDPGVVTIDVTGPHLLRRAGDVIEVTSDGDIGPSLDGFSLIRPPHTLEDLRTLSLGKQLVVRVNPSVVVDAEVTGGSLRVSGVPQLGRVRVSAGSMKCTDVARVEDCLVQMGSATISGCFTQGRSRVRAESGSMTVRLDPDSQVSVRAEAQMGGVSWPGDQAYDEYVLGAGGARLDLAVVMGHVSVRVRPTLEEEAAAEQARRETKAANEAARAEAREQRRAARAAREAAKAEREAARQERAAAAEPESDSAEPVPDDASRAASVDVPGDGGADDGATEGEPRDVDAAAEPAAEPARAETEEVPEPPETESSEAVWQGETPAKAAPRQEEAGPDPTWRGPDARRGDESFLDDVDPRAAFTEESWGGASPTSDSPWYGTQVFSQHGWDDVPPTPDARLDEDGKPQW